MWSVVLVTAGYALWAIWSTSLQPFPGSWNLLKAQYAALGTGVPMYSILGAAYVLYNSVQIAIATGVVAMSFLLNFVPYDQLTEWQCATLTDRLQDRLWNWWNAA